MSPEIKRAPVKDGVDQRILSSPVDEILNFILDEEILLARNPRVIGIEWALQRPDNIPSYTELLREHDNDQHKAYWEFERANVQGKNRQNYYWNVFSGLLNDATSADDFEKLIDVHDYLFEYSVGKPTVSPPNLLKRMANRAVELFEDPTDGEVAPDDVAEFLLPFAEKLIAKYTQPNANGEIEYIGSDFSRQLLDRNHSPANAVVASRLRRLLLQKGYDGFKPTSSSKRYDHKVALTYASLTTIAEVRRRLKSYNGFDLGANTLPSIQNIIRENLEAIVLRGDSQSVKIAQQILQAYERVNKSESEQYVGGGALRGQSLAATIVIANSLTASLNKMENLSGEEALENLDVKDLSNLPAAFQRILYAINPNFLATSLEMLIEDIAFASPLDAHLRASMLYVEMLAKEWADYTIDRGITIGDYVLRQRAKGESFEEITKKINNMGKPDINATGNFHRIVRDNQTRKNRVIYNRHKPGYGVIS